MLDVKEQTRQAEHLAEIQQTLAAIDEHTPAKRIRQLKSKITSLLNLVLIDATLNERR